MAPELPSGVVTFLFTDIEGSTRLLQHVGEVPYADLQEMHRGLLRAAFAVHRGIELRTEGDSFFMAFVSADDAIAGALDAQLALASHAWPDHPIRVRMGLDTGPATPHRGEYTALVVNRAERISAAAHGGQVLASAATTAAITAPPGGASLRSLGRHRLKDLAAPIELFQLVHPGLASTFPAPTSLEMVAHSLPVQVSSFVGRVIERAEVAKALVSARLVSLVGPGGAGKTRLAYQVAADTIELYAGGVWVAEASAVRDPSHVAPLLLRPLGLRDEPGRTAAETLVDHLRTRSALIVLDNCEHVIEAAASLAHDLLSGCPEVRVIATSRQALRVAGEVVYPVPGLAMPVPELPDNATYLEDADAIRLFVSRAADVRPDFTLTPDNADAVTAICARLDGLPLAIELAASRVRSLSPAQISERLTDALELLTKGARVADRHATLRSTIEWSHRLLPEPEQTLFRRLAVFTGGWRLDAVEDVCPGGSLPRDAIVDALDALVEKSLVAVREDDAGDFRYRLLDTIGAYAGERLAEAGEDAALAGRLAGWCLAFAAPSPARATGDDDDVRRFDRFEAEHPNLLAGLRWLHDQGDERELELADAIADFWVTRGHWRLARERFVDALANHTRPSVVRAAVLADLATVASTLGDLTDARAHFDDSLAAARALDDRVGECRALGGLGTVAWTRGDYDEAGARFEAALVMARDLGDRAKEGHWLAHLGAIAYSRARYADAQAHMEEALVIAREVGDRAGEGHWLVNLAAVAGVRGDYDAVQRRSDEALQIARELGDLRSEVAALGSLGGLAATLGDYAVARGRMEEAVDIARQIGDRWAEGRWLGRLGGVMAQLGDSERARSLLDDALHIAREIGDRTGDLLARAEQARVALTGGDAAGAQEQFEAALTIAREVGDRPGEARSVVGLAEVAVSTFDYGSAVARLRDGLALVRALENTVITIAAFHVLADLLAGARRHPDAVALVAYTTAVQRDAGIGRHGGETDRVGHRIAELRAHVDYADFTRAWQSGEGLDRAAAFDLAERALASIIDS